MSSRPLPDLARAAAAIAERGSTLGRPLYLLDEVASTNDEAKRAAKEGATHGATWVAEAQTAGRGRQGRAWVSTRGENLLVSVLARVTCVPSRLPPLALVAGLAARDAAAEELDAIPDIRWPNDVLVHGRKFCGILTEMRAEPDRIHYAVVGIGMNVNQSRMPEELEDIATSLRIDTGKTHSRLEVLIRLLRHLDRYYNQFLTEGATPILRRFAEVSSYFRGKRVRITTSAETFTGSTAGLEPNGVLRVARDDRGSIELVLSGDVSEAE